MSIGVALNALLGAGKLVIVPSLFTGYETARTMIVSPDILAEVTPPFPDTEDGRRLGEVRAWLDNFSEDGEISVAENPFEKPPNAMLARVDPPGDEFWSIRVTDPEDTPGIRGFGGFSEQDWFVAVTWEYRENIEDFNAAVLDAMAAWQDFFGTESPLKGDSLDEYLTNYRAV
jgi:hypothetical protein